MRSAISFSLTIPLIVLYALYYTRTFLIIIMQMSGITKRSHDSCLFVVVLLFVVALFIKAKKAIDSVNLLPTHSFLPSNSWCVTTTRSFVLELMLKYIHSRSLFYIILSTTAARAYHLENIYLWLNPVWYDRNKTVTWDRKWWAIAPTRVWISSPYLYTVSLLRNNITHNYMQYTVIEETLLFETNCNILTFNNINNPMM